MVLSKSPYRGTRDFFPQDMRLRNFIFEKMATVSETFAYEPYDGPLLEEVELYRAKSGDELINEQIYSFTDRGDRQVAIRPEMTPTLARMVAQIHREVAKPLRLYAIPNLMRYEKPQKGRLREFWQYNADIFGAGQYGEVEILTLAVAILKSFGANSENFEILINDRRFVDFVFEGLIGLEVSLTKKLYKLVDAKNKMPTEKFHSEVNSITGNEIKAKIFNDFVMLSSINEINLFLKKYLKKEYLSDRFLATLSGSETIDEQITKNYVKPLTSLFEKLKEQDLNSYIKFDPSIVRGLDYYTGIVFEIFDKHPENKRAIAGGGSYANLLQIFNEAPLEGIGMGLGEVPLKDFLVSHKLIPDFSKVQIDYLVSYQNSEDEKSANKLASQLREKKNKVEVFFGEAKAKKIYNYSDKKNVRYILFVSHGQINMKNMTTKEEKIISANELIEGKL